LFGGFLEEPGLYDVLFFGDSQFMNSMLPMELWAEYGIAGYNLEIVERVPIQMEPGKFDEFYLRTKKEKMGHILDL